MASKTPTAEGEVSNPTATSDKEGEMTNEPPTQDVDSDSADETVDQSVECASVNPGEPTGQTRDDQLENVDGLKEDSEIKAQPGIPPRKRSSLSDISKIVFFLGFALVLLVAAIIIGPTEPEIKNGLNFVQIFENKLNSLQSSFTNQTDRFWRILKNRGLAHLRNSSPRQPLVLLLAAPPPAHDVVNCLATKLSEALDPEHKRDLALVDGTMERSNPGEKVKKTMDVLLMEKFEKGHRAALIQHLELLPPPSPLLFYSYCDDQNAPHKHVAIIFTVNLPKEPDLALEPKEAEGAVEKYLSHEVWAKEDEDSVAALLSRVADTVALMNGEFNESLRTFCS